MIHHVRDRRFHRSERADRALEFWLFRQTEQRGAHAAAIGTRDGLPIAAVGDVEPLLLAAMGSLAADGQPVRDLDDLRATTIRVAGDQELVLTFCGAEPPSAAEVGAHVRRILT